MFKRIFYLTVISIGTGLLVPGCWDWDHHNHSTEPTYESGNIVREIRSVPECSGINIKTACEVYLTQDIEQSILVEADENVIDRVVTRRENGILVVGLDDGEYSKPKVKVYVSLKSIQKLTIDGAGSISVSKAFTTDYLEAVINGAGDITIKGTGNYLNCIINGAGNIQADGFMSNSVDAVVNGTGNCTVYVKSSLTASVYGVGSIYYYGNPSSLKTYVSGIGKIVRK